LRLNYYPPCPEPCDSLSVNRHSDAGALTVLLQEDGVTSLQVQCTAVAPRGPNGANEFMGVERTRVRFLSDSLFFSANDLIFVVESVKT
ncbi:unnamed protein product, partial [Sphacelaria rigidula]